MPDLSVMQISLMKFLCFSQITFLLALCVDLGIKILKKADSSKNYVINSVII